jgi:hypothetical protein
MFCTKEAPLWRYCDEKLNRDEAVEGLARMLERDDGYLSVDFLSFENDLGAVDGELSRRVILVNTRIKQEPRKLKCRTNNKDSRPFKLSGKPRLSGAIQLGKSAKQS